VTVTSYITNQQTAPCFPMVKAASLYDSFCIDDVIIWVQDGNCKKWL